MRTDLFDFELPESLIALHPASPRDSARMLVVVPPGRGQTRPAAGGPSMDGSDPLSGTEFSDHSVGDLPGLLRPGDAIVLNDTRVIPAFLTGTRLRGENNARVAFNLARRLDESRWLALARPVKRLALGDRVRFGDEGKVCFAGMLDATVAAKGDAGEVVLAFSLHGGYLDQAIAEIGEMPLPPYIAARRAPDAGDRERYQTVYAAHDGAVAAPTAGLHLTPDLFAALAAREVTRHVVTLHVGAGTFLPVKAEDTADHKMHAEWGEVTAETAASLNEVRARGGRIVAVGTTSLRLLESAAADDGTIQPFVGETAIFITPGYRFKAVDVVMTNFHLPRSTLFMLVSAFAGLETMRAAYAHAIATGYRFYSYGDASLLFRA